MTDPTELLRARLNLRYPVDPDPQRGDGCRCQECRSDREATYGDPADWYHHLIDND